MAKHPTKAQITADIAKDLRKVYLITFDSFATSVSEVAPDVDGNTRYARELLSTLQHHNLVTLTEDGEGSEAYQVVDPGTYDNHERDEAEKRIDEFLAEHLGTKPAKGSKSSKSKSDAPVSAEGTPCLCGCGEPTGKKSNYRPGHDARHAGEVGRSLDGHSDGDAERLAVLPTQALRDKARAIGENHRTKQAKRNKPTEPVEGTLTVGKKERVGRQNPDGSVEYMDDKGNWKAASKTAATTFQAG